MAETLVIGSRNVKKARELAELLEGTSWRVTGLEAYPAVPEPDEDGLTFEANAIIKAEYYAEALGLWCVADDSGLAVDALGGAPGVYSARYAGPQASDEQNNTKLLAALEHVPASERSARFVCCAATAKPGCPPHVETGVVEGRIAFEDRGRLGFGYDPLFIPEANTKTFGEMTLAEKHAISHRGRAFRKLRDYLESLR